MNFIHYLLFSCVLSCTLIINGQLTKQELKELLTLDCEQLSVTLLVFSAKPNPVWTVNVKQIGSIKTLARSLLKDYDKSISSLRITKRIMGYQGFAVGCSMDKQIYVRGSVSLENKLLQTGRSFLSPAIIRYVIENVGQLVSQTNYTVMTRINCDQVPIKGSDKVPSYNPFIENGGCFVKKQSKNNCYAYGTRIVTNTFPQPGRYSGRPFASISCEAVRQAAILDGLVYEGTKFPVGHPKKGHYVALLIWPNVDYHWIRKDANGYWSHKPGAGAVTNKDNTGSYILNPAKSDVSPWKLFCGYFSAQPSKINIS